MGSWLILIFLFTIKKGVNMVTRVGIVMSKDSGGFRHMMFTGFKRFWKMMFAGDGSQLMKHLVFSDDFGLLQYLQLGFAYCHGYVYSALSLKKNEGGGIGHGYVLMVWDVMEGIEGNSFCRKLDGMMLDLEEVRGMVTYGGMKGDSVSRGKVYSPEFRNTSAYREMVLRGEGITFRGWFRCTYGEMMSYFDMMTGWSGVFSEPDYLEHEDDYLEGRMGV